MTTVYPLQDLRKLARRRPCPLCGKKSKQGIASLQVRNDRHPSLVREVVCPEHGRQVYSVAL
jgi:hypothetical protein